MSTGVSNLLNTEIKVPFPIVSENTGFNALLSISRDNFSVLLALQQMSRVSRFWFFLTRLLVMSTSFDQVACFGLHQFHRHRKCY